jgi:drug/metabolite transporter (DMT)-like permease
MFTATSSISQRLAAAPAPGEITFSWRLVAYLLRRPVWFFGILCMIAGFGFQLAALHVGQLSLVQPVISAELLFVFAYLALRYRHRVRGREWVAAAGMAVGLGGFLFLADPAGGSTTQATAWHWMLAGAVTAAAVVVTAAAGVVPYGGRGMASPSRRAAFLAVAAGIAWGFVAAVIKELSVHLADGPHAVFTNWSPYVLLVTGAAAMFLASNAFQAGPLAASQPGLTIADPLVASLIGVTLFGEHLQHSPLDLLGEGVAAAMVVGGILLLSRSPLVSGAGKPAEAPGDGPGEAPGRRRISWLPGSRAESRGVTTNADP